MNESQETKNRANRELLRAIATDGLVGMQASVTGESAPRTVDLSASDWVAIVRFLDIVAGILREGLPIESMLGVRYRRDVRIELTGRAHAIAPGEVKFGFRVRVPGNQLLTVTFDQRAVEAIASVFLPFYAPIRGYGDPTRAEIGILEFAVLLTLSELHREGVGFDANGALESFLKRSDLVLETGPSGFPLEVRVGVDHLEGRVTLWLPPAYSKPFVRVLPPAPRREVKLDGRVAVDVRLALPPVVVPLADWKGCQPGDVLMLGITDLRSFATDCALVTHTHWRLGPVTIDVDTPSAISVIAGGFDPQPFAPAPFREGDAVMHPLVGLSKLTLERLESWKTGDRIDLQKPSQNPISLFFRGAELARGELVVVDREIGIRLSAIYVREIEA